MGPLKGIKIIEIAGIGPGPFCAMMLADMGADIIRVDRKDGGMSLGRADLLNRGRRSITVDLKDPGGVEVVLRLVEKADAIMEGFRPGVMEKLGLGPDVCMQRNRKIVFGRITGWGQEGPLAMAAGHDINYIALTGALHAIGNAGQKPIPPLNLVGDFGGGGMLLAFGMVCALLEAGNSGRGQVVDAAIVDGTAVLMTMMYGLKAVNFWKDTRGTNILDTGAHFYDTYETKDGKWVAIGAIESQFYRLLLEYAGLNDPDYNDQMEQSQWPGLKKKMAEVFKTKTRDEWCEIMEGTDACFAPVLSMEEAPGHPHMATRKAFIEYDGRINPAPAPRFSRTKPEIQSPPPVPGEHTDEALSDWGFSEEEISGLKNKGAI